MRKLILTLIAIISSLTMAIAQNTFPNDGNVGIGTLTPTTHLEIKANNNHLIFTEADGAPEDYITFFINNGAFNARFDLSDGSKFYPFHFKKPDNPNSQYAFFVDKDGNVGIGDSPLSTKFHVRGSVKADNFVDQSGQSITPFTRQTDGDSYTYDAIILGGSDRIEGYRNKQLYIYGSARITDTLSCGILELNAGSDIAEPFFSNEKAELKVGMVVETHKNMGNSLVATKNKYSKKVIGVISGANDLRPALLLGAGVFDKQVFNEPVNTNLNRRHYIPVALAGKVWVWCTNENGGITPGDLLTSSSKTGYAMKVTDYSLAVGAIIGKAITSLEYDEEGLVLMVVALQ